MGISQDANGWTLITPPAAGWQDGFRTGAPATTTTMAIFVSSSTGKDSGDGGFSSSIQGSRAQPYRTLASAKARVRSGSPDWLMLANGDTWTESLYTSGTPGGLNANDRFVVASYTIGDVTDPPIPNPGHATLAQPVIQVPAGENGLGNVANKFACLGIHFYAYTRDPNNGAYTTSGVTNTLAWQLTGDSQLIEDCTSWFFHSGGAIGLSTNSDSQKIRHCRFFDNWAIDGTVSTGIITGGISGKGTVLIENCFLDRNGWDFSQATLNDAYLLANPLSHNFYLNAQHDITLDPTLQTGNFYYNATLTGTVSARNGYNASDKVICGGHHHNNLHFMYGTSAIVYVVSKADATNIIENNVAFEMGDHTGVAFGCFGSLITSLPEYTGYNLSGATAVLTRNNIVSHSRSSNPSGTVALEGAMFSSETKTGADSDPNDATHDPLHPLSNNIAWKYGGDGVGGVAAWPSFGALTDVRFGGSTVFGNSGGNFATGSLGNTQGWLAPTRTVATYLDLILGGSGHTEDDYYTLCRAAHKGTAHYALLMAESVNDYVREGFNVAFVGSAYADGIAPPPVLMAQICM